MDDILQAVERLHGCRATYRESVEISEKFEGSPVWEGVVHIFNTDRADTDTCYAWSSPIEGSAKRKFYAVLKIQPVNSPQDAVRASIVADYRSQK